MLAKSDKKSEPGKTRAAAASSPSARNGDEMALARWAYPARLKIEEKPELCQEVVTHNRIVLRSEREYEDFDFLEKERERIRGALIRPCSEMEGEGLRRTFVAMGRAWLEDAHIVRWKEGNDRVIRQKKLTGLQRIGSVALVAVLVLANMLCLYHTIREDVIPAFGETMRKVRPDAPLFDDLSRFARTALARSGGEKAAEAAAGFNPTSLPPELRAAWEARMARLRAAAESLEIERILEDPVRKGVYYVLCDAELPDMGRVDFRLQCANRDGKYVLLALE